MPTRRVVTRVAGLHAFGALSPRLLPPTSSRFDVSLRKHENPDEHGAFAMRRRGLEPPPGYPRQGPQPCASTNSATGARAQARIALGHLYPSAGAATFTNTCSPDGSAARRGAPMDLTKRQQEIFRSEK